MKEHSLIGLGKGEDVRDLLALDADTRSVFGWRVGASGELEPVGSFEGLPETVAGLAAG